MVSGAASRIVVEGLASVSKESSSHSGTDVATVRLRAMGGNHSGHGA